VKRDVKKRSNPLKFKDNDGKNPVVVGGAAGFAVGGPIGALAGAIIAAVATVGLVQQALQPGIQGVEVKTGIGGFAGSSTPAQLNAFPSAPADATATATTFPSADPGLTTHGINMATQTPQGVAGQIIVEEKGVKIYTHGTNDPHKPAHAHVEGKGDEVRIGENGKPLKGQNELSGRQKEVVKDGCISKLRIASKF
jgi:hypothetical protein